MLRVLLPLLLLSACDALFGPDDDDTADTADVTDTENPPIDPNDPCGGITWEGECQGTEAVWCENDAVQRYDCADNGLDCGLTEEYGYWCVTPAGGTTTNPAETSTDGMLTTTTYSQMSTSQGDLLVPVNITNANQSFMVTVKGVSSSTGLLVYELRDPSGNKVLNPQNSSHFDITAAMYHQRGDNQLNWPSRPQDGPLALGEWVVHIGVTDGNNWAAREVDVTVQVKSDPNLSEGQVKVAMIYAGDLGSNATVTNGVEGAVDRWRTLWSGYGLELFVTYYDATGISKNLPSLTQGSDTYETLSGSSRDHQNADIVMIIGDWIGSSGNSTLGQAGGIPGTVVSTRRAVTIMSWLQHAGTNQQFSTTEIRMMGETMAHEAGHFMGLFHVVEQDWSSFDPLSDTSNSCSSSSTCANLLGDNLMYPTSICSGSGCVVQDVMSTQQQGVKHRYIGTL